MTFGKYIKTRRLKLDIGLRELAEQIGISPSYLTEIENNKKPAPSNDILDQIAKLLNINDDSLALFFDLAVETKGDIAEDIKKFIIENVAVRNFIRYIKDETITVTNLMDFLKN